MSTLRVGVDVGGTFTKAVAVEPHPFALRAHAVVPTTHHAPDGVTEGVARALHELLATLGPDASAVELVAFSTTQAMNALLEGDVAKVGVIGVGREPDLRPARKRTAVGDVALAPGRALRTEHVFLDATGGLSVADVDAALDRLVAAGCGAIAASGAFAVDAPEAERLIALRARERGLPTCAGHELSGAYGLELRTVSAAVNASILPLMERTAHIVQEVLHRAEIDVPLLVLRGDGGAMSLEAFASAPSLSVGAGPAAGVAAALHQLELTQGIVLECGGTSSNVSVVAGGRTVLRTLKVMGRPTAIRSVDSWVVGAAGGSMARLRKRKLVEVGPRSAHVAGLAYASFAAPAELEGAALTLVAPRAGDPEAYAAVRTRAGDVLALTATCAANALGLVEEGTHAAGSQAAALAAFAPLAAHLRTSPERAARALLDAAVAKIAGAVAEAAKAHDFGPDVPIVALGGAGPALAGEVARALGRPLLAPDHPEVLSSIGAALSLVRVEVVRSATGDGTGAALAAHAAERACVAAGAAPDTVRVECVYEPREGQLRAVATGAVALERGAAGRAPVGEPAQQRAAALALGVAADGLRLVTSTEYYRVYGENGGESLTGPASGSHLAAFGTRGPIAVVDPLGSVPLAERARQVLTGEKHEVLAALDDAVSAATVQLGVASMLPRVALVCGARIIDTSEARRPEDILLAARSALADHDGPAVAVLWR
ncbi:MAG TPA: hydantoinase/oxoprolinase family protein [Conexibacter sp.]|nr:hydantoinase/oxoprolinase family protein [Conexibacter sp.]